MSGELGTTNLLLGIMAAVSVLEALAIIGIGIAGYMVYSKVTTLIEGLETRQVAPAMARVNAILDDVKDVSAKVKAETERVDTAIHDTIDRIDNTADMTTPPAATISSAIGSGTASPLLAISHALAASLSCGHHCSISMTGVSHRATASGTRASETPVRRARLA